MASGPTIKSHMVLDDSEFKAGADRVARRSKRLGQEIEKTSANAEKAAKKSSIAIGKLFAGVAVGAALNKSRQRIEAVDQAARQLGVTAEEIQKVRFIAEQNHSDLNTYVNALTRMERKLGDLEKNKGAAEAAEQLNINIKEFRELRPVDQIAALADAFRGADDRGAALSALFGLLEDDAKKIAVAFNQTGDSIRKTGDSIDTLSGDKVKDFIAAADAAAAAWDNVWQVIDAGVVRAVDGFKFLGRLGKFAKTAIFEGVDEALEQDAIAQALASRARQTGDTAGDAAARALEGFSGGNDLPGIGDNRGGPRNPGRSTIEAALGANAFRRVGSNEFPGLSAAFGSKRANPTVSAIEKLRKETEEQTRELEKVGRKITETQDITF